MFIIVVSNFFFLLFFFSLITGVVSVLLTSCVFTTDSIAGFIKSTQLAFASTICAVLFSWSVSCLSSIQHLPSDGGGVSSTSCMFAARSSLYHSHLTSCSPYCNLHSHYYIHHFSVCLFSPPPMTR